MFQIVLLHSLVNVPPCHIILTEFAPQKLSAKRVHKLSLRNTHESTRGTTLRGLVQSGATPEPRQDGGYL